MELDKIDFRIIELLKENGRITHEAIATKVHLSRPAVRNRVLALENENVITGYSTEIDYNKLGYPIQVLIYLKMNNTTYQMAVKAVEDIQMSNILEYSLYRISGEWSILIKIMSKTQQSLTIYLDRLKDIEGITATNTVFLFNA